MYMDTNFPPPIPATGRLAQFMRLVQAFERDEIEAGVDLLIAALDARDGDPDMEDDDRAGVLMIADAVDYDPADEIAPPDGFPGDPVDAEDSDDDGCITDEPHDPETDYGAEEAGEPGSWPEGTHGGHLAIADDEGEEDSTDRATRRPFRDMIRRTRCIVERSGTKFDGTRWVDYRHHNRPMPPMGIMAS